MRLGSVLAISLLVLAVAPAQAEPTPARHMARHRPAAAAVELLSADILNAMVLDILAGRPLPALTGSDARQRAMQAAWARLRTLLGSPPRP